MAAWNTRDLLVAVVISVVLGVILIPVLLYTHALMMVIPPFVSGLSTGLWVIAGIMIAYRFIPLLEHELRLKRIQT